MKLKRVFGVAVMNLMTKTVENADLISDKLLSLLEENFQKLTMTPKVAPVRIQTSNAHHRHLNR